MIVQTKNGKVEGFVKEGLWQFLGIPYAKAPVGNLRFKPSLPAENWEGVRECKHYGHAAPQLYVAGLTNLKEGETLNEDCLFLNVTTPKIDAKKRPVLFWIHGGAFQKGSATLGVNPLAFAKEGIVVVNANYRIGALGFLDFSEYLGPEYQQSGNDGLLDILQALRWTKANIQAFGGDPDNITVMGQSAGAKIAGTLTIMKSAKGLFAKAVMCSGSVQSIRDQHTARRVTEMFMKEAGLNKETAKKLLTMPWEEILNAQKNLFAGLNLHTVGPVFDGINFDGTNALEIIKKGTGNTVPILTGTNRDEINLYYYVYKFHELDEKMAKKLFGKNAPIVLADYQKIPKDNNFHKNFIHLTSEYIYRAGANQMAKAVADAGQKVYLYRLDWDRQQYKACHTSECQFIMGESPIVKDVDHSPEHEVLAKQMHGAVINFLKNGKPTAEGLVEWPLFNSQTRQMMVFDAPCHVATSPKVETDPRMPHQVFALD